MTVYYAGIGSRETPKEVCEYMCKLGIYFAERDFVLRSGHADGADKAFEFGCRSAGGRMQIFIPWKGFNGSDSSFSLAETKAYDIAKKFHPAWDRLSDGAKKLQARNSYQILGHDLNTPSSFVICWTKGGKGEGGTGQAIRLANAYNIPVFDIGKYGDMKVMTDNLRRFMSEVTNNV